MPIIAKPASIQKNVPASFSLDKTALAAVPSVVADSYFSDSTNWSKVLLFYKSSAGNQKEVVSFDATQTSPTANFLASEKARDIFEIQKIIITDFDDGVFEISRSQLTTSEFDVNMSAQTGTAVVWDTFISGFTLGADGAISKAGAVSDYGHCPRSSVELAGDFELRFEALDTDILNGWCVGVSKSISANPELGSNQYIFYHENGNMSLYIQSTFIVQNIPIQAGNNIFKLVRSNYTLSFYMNNNLIYSSGILDKVYPEARVGGAVKKATLIKSELNNILWNFVANPSYSLNAQNEIVSTKTAVDWSPEGLLVSINSYTIGNGLEYKLKVDNGFFPNTIPSQYLGARITESGVYGGYTRDYAINQYGVQNNHNHTYPYPISAEIEFKMIIKVNETLFYVNNVLIDTMPPIASGITSSTQITPVVRFNNQYNVKEYSLIAL